MSTKIIPMFVSNIIPVEDILVRREVVETHFACDLEKCKGACCTLESDFGAPLLNEEVEKIEEILPIVKKNLSPLHQKEIDINGFYEIVDNELLTRSIEKKDCVFVYYDGKIAKCGIEKAFNEGKTDFRKPISCHLFPIRVSNFGGEIIKYEKFQECSPALENGKKKQIKIVDFCEDSLTRKYGEKWYSKLKEIITK
ncbi:MAG: DUF3109 family protein [Ignavibacteriaceae bacterium]